MKEKRSGEQSVPTQPVLSIGNVDVEAVTILMSEPCSFMIV